MIKMKLRDTWMRKQLSSYAKSAGAQNNQDHPVFYILIRAGFRGRQQGLERRDQNKKGALTIETTKKKYFIFI